MSDTPRTDNAAGDGTTVPADFAADLEHELNAAKAEVERLQEELAQLTTLQPACDHNNATLVLAMYRQGTRQRLTRHLEPWECWVPLPDVKEPK